MTSDTPTARQEPTLQERLRSGGCYPENLGWMKEAAAALDAAQAREDRLRAAIKTECNLIIQNQTVPHRVQIAAERLIAKALEDRP